MLIIKIFLTIIFTILYAFMDQENYNSAQKHLLFVLTYTLSHNMLSNRIVFVEISTVSQTHLPANFLYRLLAFAIKAFTTKAKKLGGGCNPKKPNATANFKFGTGFFSVFFGFFLVFFDFFSVFPFWPILTGLTASC